MTRDLHVLGLTKGDQTTRYVSTHHEIQKEFGHSEDITLKPARLLDINLIDDGHGSTSVYRTPNIPAPGDKRRLLRPEKR